MAIYEELEPFYTAAEQQVGVNGVDETDYSGQNRGSPYPPRPAPFPLPPEAKPYALQRFQARAAARGYRWDHAPNVRLSQPYAGRPACIGNNIRNPSCPIGAKHSGIHDLEAAQRAGARLRTVAVVDQLKRDGSGRITAVSYLDPQGNRSTLTAKIYVIAAHGFETPKLLLMNELANRSGMVGKNLMPHPTLSMALYADEPLWVGRGQYLHGANLQHRLRPDRGQVSGGFYQFMNHNAALSSATALFKENGGLIGERLDEELRWRASRYMSVQLLLEDLPDPSNTVTVHSGFRDKLGQPGIKVHYRLQPYSKAALSCTQDDFANWLQAMNGVPQEAPGATWYNQHHIMGTVIMGGDPTGAITVDGPQRQRGRLLVETLGHCAACHTPRGDLMQQLPERHLGGAMTNGWWAPNITSDASGIGGWSDEQLLRFLRTGHTAVVEPAGPRDAQHMVSHATTDGSLLYQSACASCHGVEGAGSVDLAHPSLTRVEGVAALHGSTLVQVISHGVDRKVGQTHAFMPGFRNDLDNAQIAAPSNHVRSAFGGIDDKLDASQVRTILNGEIATPWLIRNAQWLAIVAIAVLVLVVVEIALLFIRSRRRRTSTWRGSGPG